MRPIPGRLGREVAEGNISRDDAITIMRYRRGWIRFEERGGELARYLTVAQAYLKDQKRRLEGKPRKHFQKYHSDIITAIEERIGHSKMILDPMAGTMERLRCLERPDRGYHLVWGVEYEREWVEAHPHDRLIQGDARELPFDDEFFDVIIVSPSYGNRDSDRTGDWWDNVDRKTYAAGLGRNVSRGSLCVPFEYPEYKIGHSLAWCEATRVLKTGGLFVINLKNFVKRGVIVRVSQWHRELLRDKIGLEEVDDTAIATKGRMSGENYDVRAENAEKIYFFSKPALAHHRAGTIAEHLRQTERLLND